MLELALKSILYLLDNIYLYIIRDSSNFSSLSGVKKRKVDPILKLEKNLDKFPHCIADDIKRQVHELSTSVYQIRGYIKGRTLLPFPQVDKTIFFLIVPIIIHWSNEIV